MDVYQMITARKRKMAVIGMGYAGMPLALAFANKAEVIGFDINAEKIELYQQGIDPTGEVGSAKIGEAKMEFTSDENRLDEAVFFIIAVPTPVNPDQTPDLTPLFEASRIVGRHLTPGALVVYESTVYPGVTETVCAPILERESGMQCGSGFKIGYSPERINVGDRSHRVENITKIVSAMDNDTLEQVSLLYGLVIRAGLHRVSNIKVAEAAKIVENSQRDLNIAFMNEVAMAFDRMDIDTLEVLEAAGTKWNFMDFRPGLVGGHCIGVDPYYFLYEAKKRGYSSTLIAAGRQINNGMAGFVVDKTVKMLEQAQKNFPQANVYIFGITFKENCHDIRNSKVFDMVRHLRARNINPQVVDPLANAQDVQRSHGISLTPLNSVTRADCIIFAVAHDVFKNISPDRLDGMFAQSEKNEEKVIIDVKGVCDKEAITKRGYRYWRL